MQVNFGNMFNNNDVRLTLVTTNSYVNKRGDLVMGRGAALQLKNMFPILPKSFGQKILDTCGHLGEYNILYAKMKSSPTHDYGIFQVKYRFSDKADLGLIERSTERLKKLAEKLSDHTIALNFPGIGYGHLKEEEVLPIIQELPDNVLIYKLRK